MKKVSKIVSAFLIAVLLISSISMAGSVYVNEDYTDLWTMAIKTDQVRLFGNGTYRANFEWPGTTGLRNAGYPGCLFEGGSYSIEEVFGEKCTDLLYTELEDTKDMAEYMKDGDRWLTNYEMKEWNGFLFVLVGGNKTVLSNKTVTDTYGNNLTYAVADRSDSSGVDSYLYVFDISKGENYGKARYAKWSAAELGLQNGNAKRFMEGIFVDDNYIYIITNNNNNGSNRYGRGIAVFENTVMRGKEATLPKRADIVLSDYEDGVKNFIPAAMTDANCSYENFVTDKNIVSVSQKTFSLTNPLNRKDGAMIWVTPFDGTVESSEVYYSSNGYLAESDSSGISIASLLKCSNASDWSSTTSPTIRDICVDGNEIIFLVTYGLNGKYYKQIFVTDWTDAYSPVLLDEISYEDTAVASASSQNFSGLCYSYDDYIYVSSVYGIDVIEKYDDNDNVALSYTSALDLSGSKYSGYLFRLAVYGNHLYAWVNQDQNHGIEVKARFSDDKTAIEDWAEKVSARRTDRVIRYNGRIYTQWAYAQTKDAIRQACIYVADTNDLVPVSLTVNPVLSVATAPYVIEGYGQNIEAVYVKVNGVDCGYVEAKDDGSGLDKWKYVIGETGDYVVEFTGASMVGYPQEETTEKVDFTIVDKSDIMMSASYEIVNGMATVNVSVTNSNAVDLEVIPIIAFYSDDMMETVSFGKKTKVLSGQTVDIPVFTIIPENLVDYKIKTFLIEGLKTIAPVTEAIEK